MDTQAIHPIRLGGQSLAKDSAIQRVHKNSYYGDDGFQNTERPWRKRGLAGLLMQRVLDWAANSGLETLVLHASDNGRRLYKRLGFIATNEMRYPSALLRRPKDHTR
jgi:GNAT superfamily N-acetyltransferase